MHIICVFIVKALPKGAEVRHWEKQFKWQIPHGYEYAAIITSGEWMEGALPSSVPPPLL